MSDIFLFSKSQNIKIFCYLVTTVPNYSSLLCIILYKVVANMNIFCCLFHGENSNSREFFKCTGITSIWIKHKGELN